ncbi:hypothetical protein AGDE_15475 [Angomonas deanei]|uniref:Uncharacterized protein n=1 Tax=Angomonas deanei TaxID=59799 RepID=A0A7G2CS06_9TRYP|nr:hypothetical protein AGDE_15475 [Angomonas deanei]CAD2222608.1 hypothetical protein, conserved [Angomonas deanei]|eukprot:EPY19023.1 hypothetical protein AGDE_15475 [Angomonas deanei]
MHKPTRPASAAEPAVKERNVNISKAPGKARSASANPTNRNMAQVAVSETRYLEEQLKDLLQRQGEVDRQHQRELLTFRHTMRSLYDENAVLRNITNAAQRRLRLGGETDPDLPSSITEAELEHLNMRINLATRKCNRLIHEINLLKDGGEVQEALHVSRRSLAVEEREIGANRPLFLRIQRLENRLDEVLKKQNTVRVVTRGYETHYQDLKQDSKHYDVRMQTLEKELADRHRDYLQLLTLYRNLEDDMKAALKEEEEFGEQFHRNRRSKEKALQEKKASVEAALLDTAHLERKAAELEHVLLEEMQLLESAEMTQETLERRLLGDTTAEVAEDAHTAEEEEKLAAFDAAFQSMLGRSGCHDVDELVGVYRRERQQLEELRAQVEDARRERQEAAEALKRTKAEVQTAKVCGPTDTSTSPVLEEELRSFLQEEKANYAKARERREESQRELQKIVFAVNQLIQKVAYYRPDVALRPAQTPQDTDFPLTVAVLTQKLLALADDTTHGGVPQTSASQSAQIVLPAHNVRVRLPAKEPKAGGKVAAIGSSAAAGILRRRATSYVSDTNDYLDAPRAGSVESSEDTTSEEEENSEGEGPAETMKGTLPPSKARKGKKTVVTSVPAEFVEEPLTREDVKRMSAAVESREKKRIQREKERLRRAGQQ